MRRDLKFKNNMYSKTIMDLQKIVKNPTSMVKEYICSNASKTTYKMLERYLDV